MGSICVTTCDHGWVSTSHPVKVIDWGLSCCKRHSHRGQCPVRSYYGILENCHRCYIPCSWFIPREFTGEKNALHKIGRSIMCWGNDTINTLMDNKTRRRARHNKWTPQILSRFRGIVAACSMVHNVINELSDYYWRIPSPMLHDRERLSDGDPYLLEYL